MTHPRRRPVAAGGARTAPRRRAGDGERAAGLLRRPLTPPDPAMELENIVANTVLLKAREGTATPAPLPGAVPVPFPRRAGAALPTQPPCSPLPTGTAVTGLPPAPPALGTPGPLHPRGGWLDGLVPVGIDGTHPRGDGCPAAAGRVRLSVLLLLQTQRYGAENLKSDLGPFPNGACAEMSRPQDAGQPGASLPIRPSVHASRTCLAQTGLMQSKLCWCQGASVQA